MAALRRSPPWRFAVTDLDLQTLLFLDRRATGRGVTYALRQPTEIRGRVPADDPEIYLPADDGEPLLAEGTRLLIGLRREGASSGSLTSWRARANGIITQVTRSVQNDVAYVDFTAYDPRAYLHSRPIRKQSGSSFPLPGPEGLTFKNQRGSDILLALLNRTITADGPVWIDTTSGTIEDTDRITITFQQTASVGDAIDQLEATGTMDVLLPAIYDPIGSPGNIVELNVHQLAGSVRHGAIMAFDLPSHSLEAPEWLEDGSERANNIELYTTNGIATVPRVSTASVAKYRSYWRQQRFPVQAQVEVLEAEAAVDLLLRKEHPTTLSLTPVTGSAPVPLTEYKVADWLPTYASRRLGKPLSGEYRVYEMELELLDDATETARLLMSADALPTPTVDVAPFTVAIEGVPEVGETLSAVIG